MVGAKTLEGQYQIDGFQTRRTMAIYTMEGPDGERENCRVDIIHRSQQIYSGKDAFTDENGNINKDMPTMVWKVEFTRSEDGTRVNVEMTFPSQADLEKIVEMGFEQGFAAAHNNLDELLASL
jgi:hypothetical protein